MSTAKKPTRSIKVLIAMTFALLAFGAGCSTAGMPSSTEFAAFLTDFAREALAAWLL